MSTFKPEFKNFIDNINNVVITLTVQDRFSSFQYNIYDEAKKALKPIEAPMFEYTGDAMGPIMPHMHRSPAGHDVGPTRPSAKLVMKADHPLFNIISKTYDMVSLAYASQVIRNCVEKSNKALQWAPGFEFYGFVERSREGDEVHVVAATSEGYLNEIKSKIVGSDSKLLKRITILLGGVESVMSFELGRSIVSTPKKGNGSRVIYLDLNLRHNSWPNDKRVYRKRNEAPTPEMLKAINWGIVIPCLASEIHTIDGVECKKYIQPHKPINWVGRSEYGYVDVTDSSTRSYFYCLAHFRLINSTHEMITAESGMSVKFNLNDNMAIYKLPEKSSFSRELSSGCDRADISEEDVLHAHMTNAPIRSVLATAPVPQSKAKGLKRPANSDDDE